MPVKQHLLFLDHYIHVVEEEYRYLIAQKVSKGYVSMHVP